MYSSDSSMSCPSLPARSADRGALDGAHPRERITVKELRRLGLGDLAAADLNRDGWVDARDIQLFTQAGGAPNPPRPALDTDTARW